MIKLFKAFQIWSAKVSKDFQRSRENLDVQILLNLVSKGHEKVEQIFLTWW